MTIRRIVFLCAAFIAPLVDAAVAPAETPPLPRSAMRLLVADFGSGGIDAVNSDGSDRRKLIAEGGDGDQTADGSRIVYVRTTTRVDESGFYRNTATLHLADGDGSNQRPLANGRIFGTNPRWSPDGTRIAFDLKNEDVRIDQSPPDLIAIVDAAQTTDAVTVIAAGRHPDWSPDGSQLVFWANNRLWTISARAGSSATAITSELDAYGTSVEPRWSPDGTVIGFGGRSLSLVHPDGSGQRTLFGGDSWSYVFAGWGPDSRSFASHYSGFHHWSSSSWTDPATGTHESSPNGWVTDWAGASGGPVTCGSGYWLLGRDGGVFTFGAAAFHGSTGGMRLNQPVVGMAATPTGNGYWLVASDGGIFTFGDATFHGSTGALHLKAPVVGMATTPTGNGYWLVASDGGIFTFGDATFHGSTGAMQLASPIVGMAPTATGGGYLLAGGDGGVFTFGEAQFPGSATDPGLATRVAAVEGVGDGMLLATTTGEVVALGDARFCGSTKHLRLAAPIVGAAVID